MEIHAYSRDYLDDAQRVLGEAFDFAINTLEYSSEDVAVFFVNSDVSRQLERGNPKYIAGMNGCEVMRLILEQNGIDKDHPDEIDLDKSPEYWGGWALAFYQWYTLRSFEEILTAVPLEQIIRMYPTYHEMDLLQFVDAMDQRIRQQQSETRLAWRRRLTGLSRQQLSERSGVPVDIVEELESGKRNINKTEAATVFGLSVGLGCRMEELLEKGKL